MTGELPQGWACATLGQVAKWGSGGTPSRQNSAFFSGHIPWIKTGELGGKYVRSAEEYITAEAVDNSSAKIFPSGSVGIAMYGATIGKTSIWALDASTNQACAVAQCLPELLFNEFLYYFLISQQREFINAGKGGAQPNISQGVLKDWPIVLPPVNEQRRIVVKIEELFSELDKGIENLTTVRTQLKAYRHVVLKHAFEGKLTVDWRATNPGKLETPDALLSRTRAEREARYAKALGEWQEAISAWRAQGEVRIKPSKPMRPEWPEAFDSSGLPPLPKGWAYVPFGALANSIRNGISQKPDETGTLKIFRISAVRPLAFDLSDFRHIDDNEEYKAYRLRRGDLVFTRYNGSRAYVGVAAVYLGDESHVYPDKLIRCDVKSDIVDTGFLEKAVNCGASRAFIESRIRTTAGQAGISGADIKAMPVAICALEEQNQINRILDAQLSQIDQLEAEVDAELTKSSALRQSILQKAFSGKLAKQDPSDPPASVLLRNTTEPNDDKVTGQTKSNKSNKKEAA